MNFEKMKVKADLFFEFPTENRDHVTTTSAILFAMDCCANDPWLSLAHIICADQGIPPGHIMARLEMLRDKLDDDLK